MPPDNVLAGLYRQAKAAFDAGDLPAAESRCRELLKHKGNSFEILMLSAFVAGAVGRGEREVDLVTRAVRLRRKDAQLRTHLGMCLVGYGRLPEALTQFGAALKIQPGLPMAVAGQARVQERQDRYDLARRGLERHLSGARTPPEVADGYLRVLLHDGNVEEAITFGAAIRAAGHPAGLPLRSMCFSLAQAYERAGDVERAFDTAMEANAMERPSYSIDDTRRSFDGIIGTFTPEATAAFARSRVDSEAPIFIVGLPRCGSTLVERILATHPAVHGAGEVPTVRLLTFDLRETLATGYPGCMGELTESSATSLGEKLLAAVVRGAPRADRVTDKFLENYLYLGLIAALLPRARVIHCRRDPVDTCLSCFMSPLNPGQAPYATDLEQLGLHHREYERLMTHWRAVLDLAVLDLSYEALVDDQRGVTQSILDFCGLPWDDACLRYHETKRRDRTLSFDQVRQPIYRSSVRRAAAFGARLDPLRRSLNG